MYIEIEQTPNPSTLKFLFLDSLDLPKALYNFSRENYHTSPFAKALLSNSQIASFMLTPTFVSVTKVETSNWKSLSSLVIATIVDFLMSGQAIIEEQECSSANNTKANVELTSKVTRCDGGDENSSSDSHRYQYTEQGQKIVEQIQAILAQQIEPAVQADGGSVDFIGFDETSGILYLKMLGACSGCPSASITLKSGIERMMRYYVPEVQEVQQVL